MNVRLLKYAAPVIAGLGVLAATAPASARCYYDSYGYRTCYRPAPPVYYGPPPVVYAPPPAPYYLAPPPRVVMAPPPRPYYHRHYGQPVVNFGFGVTF
ncbi:MAG: hypothetical protein IT561_24460 [Alphaproteobacteria bacterium]|nr:hypothetical protein [Alphaproteobacteria bacterium]